MALRKFFAAMIFVAAVVMSSCNDNSMTISNAKEFMNVSYDTPREFYAAYNEKFHEHWTKKLRKGDVILMQSFGGSHKQALAVIDGLEADVVTLASAYDIVSIKNAGLIRGGWRNEFPYKSSPYTSTIVFLVRKDNPKNIRDWNDLTRPDVKIVMSNPKTSGGAQWNYLAAWEFARRQFNGDDIQIRDFMRKIFNNVVSLDDGARGATNSFAQRGQGDVLISWENEALFSIDSSPDKYEIVTPSLSILAETSVAVVDKIVEQKGTRELAEEYINYLYSPEGQEIAAQNFYRPRNAEILAKYSDRFKPLELFTIDEAFGGWVKAYNDHFADGATFDQIYKQ